jgi:hypothetical protein
MSDPLRQLADLDTERLGVRPVPPADVRARGDRLRRRRYATATLGTAAFVALVGIGASVLGGSGPAGPSPAPPAPSATPSPTEDATDPPSPSPSSPAAALTIPEDFPLTASYPDANEDGTPVRFDDRPGVGGLVVCGESILTSVGAADAAGAKYVGIEDFRARTLLLFESEADSLAVVQRAQQAVSSCPTFDEASFTPMPVALGEASFGFDQRYASMGGFDLGLSSYLVVQVGRAVLIGTAYGEANGSPDTRAAFNERLVDDARDVVIAMADLP